MKLIDDWRDVLKRAWSIKFTGLSLVLSAVEVYVQLFKPDGVPGGAFAALAASVSLLAGVTRILAQQEKGGVENGEPSK